MLYFAYGSNLDEQQMNQRCPDSGLLCKGCLKDYRLDFTKYAKRWGGGVADVIQNPGSEVWGMIYELPESDLLKLDRFEGYPHSYTRIQVTIETEDGTLDHVWVYYVVKKSEFIPPSRIYLGKIMDAAVRHNFPESYQAMLKQIQTVDTQ